MSQFLSTWSWSSGTKPSGSYWRQNTIYFIKQYLKKTQILTQEGCVYSGSLAQCNKSNTQWDDINRRAKSRSHTCLMSLSFIWKEHLSGVVRPWWWPYSRPFCHAGTPLLQIPAGWDWRRRTVSAAVEAELQESFAVHPLLGPDRGWAERACCPHTKGFTYIAGKWQIWEYSVKTITMYVINVTCDQRKDVNTWTELWFR